MKRLLTINDNFITSGDKLGQNRYPSGTFQNTTSAPTDTIGMDLVVNKNKIRH